jgi:cell division protein FtsA
MSQKTNQLIVALDIGSMYTRVVAAELIENSLRYRGHGVVDSAGMRKGLISELPPAIKAVRAAVVEAERSGRNLNISDCAVGVGGPHTWGLNTTGGFDLGSRMREITRDDVRNAVDRARSVERPPDREILHLLHRQFILDEQPGIFDPVGMVGARLEVDLHIATCSGSALQSTVTCANRSGVKVSDAVLESLAAAEGTLSADERELGVCLLDIGAHSTELAVFYEGAVVHTASIPIGGMHFTNDLAVGMSMSTALAEELKRVYGNAVVTDVPLHLELEIANPEPQIIRQRALAEILEARAVELMRFVRRSLQDGGVAEALGAGCVLTGGGALLTGMLDVTESQLRVPARVASPVRISHMPSDLVHPSFAVAIGTLLYVQRTRATRAAERQSVRSRLKNMFTSSF